MRQLRATDSSCNQPRAGYVSSVSAVGRRTGAGHSRRHTCFAEKRQERLYPPTGDAPGGQKAQMFMGSDIPRAVIGCSEGFKGVAPGGKKEANICWKVCVLRDVSAL